LQVRLDSPLALPWGPTAPVFPEQHFEQLPHLSPLDERMPQGKIGYDLVAVPPSLSLPQHVASFDQLGEDPVGGALGDPDRGGDVPQADSGVINNAGKDVGVVGQEVPRWLLISRKRIHEYMIHLSPSTARRPAMAATETTAPPSIPPARSVMPPPPPIPPASPIPERSPIPEGSPRTEPGR
jgi:hypothetical protein